MGFALKTKWIALVPTFLPDQRHEADRAEILASVAVLACAGDLDQALHRIRLSDRHDQSAPDAELPLQRRRHMRSAGGGEDRVERRVLRLTRRAIALDDPDVAVAEPPHPLHREAGELGVPLDGDHLARDP